MKQRLLVPGLLSIVLTACSIGASAQSKEFKKTLTDNLASVYPITEFSLFDKSTVSKAGPIFIIQADGVLAERIETDSIRPTYVKNGKLRQDNGVVGLVGAILNNRKIEPTRTFKKGDRVYIYKVFTDGKHFEIGFASVDLWDVNVAGTTNAIRYKGAYIFEFGTGVLETMDMEAVQATVRPFLRAETEATRPKSISLGNSLTEVEATLGKPETVVNLGAKTIYTYKSMKVIFTDGKVSDVQ